MLNWIVWNIIKFYQFISTFFVDIDKSLQRQIQLHILIASFKNSINHIYQPLRSGQDMTQGQFLSGV